MVTEKKEEKKPESKFIQDFRAVRRAGVPLAAIETSDPADCIRQIFTVSNKDPLIKWDKVEGFNYINDAGEQALEKVLGSKGNQGDDEQDNWAITDLDKALRIASNFPGKGKEGDGRLGTILFIMNGHRYIGTTCPEELAVNQALWNLRDQYKKDKRLVVITCPFIQLPEELKQDVVILDHPLPTDEELAKITSEIYKAASVEKPEKIDKIIEGVKGLSAFSTEQVLAMSITKDGMDMDRLWTKKKKTVEQTPGMRIYRGPEKFSSIEGIEYFKNYLKMIMESDNPPTFIIFMDEIEKQLSGTKATDTTMQEMHGQLLTWMADEEVLALLMTGQPGCTKSFSAKAVAGEYDKLLAVLNLSEVKSKWVGESTGQMKTILKTASSLGKPLLLATSNNVGDLSPELRDRFSLGIWYFEFPDKKTRAALWNMYRIMHKVSSKPTFDDDLWSPRNIRDCCALAARLKCSIDHASKFIVPVKLSDPSSIEAKRKVANGRFLSAEHAGVYEYKKNQPESSVDIRSIDVSKVGEA